MKKAEAIEEEIEKLSPDEVEAALIRYASLLIFCYGF